MMTARNMKLPKAVMPVLCTVLLLCCNAIRAQLPVKAEGLEQSRLVTRATMYGVGVTNVFDTYLSPQEYTGIDFRVSRESMRMTRWMDGKLSLQSFFQADLGYTHNKVDNNNTFSGVVKFTSLHNQPSLRQMLTADFPIGRAKMRFAYIWDAQQSKVNDIKTHTYSHVFMVGFVKELYLLKNKKKR